MTDLPDSPDIEFSQFMHTDPLYDSEQTARYQRIKQTSHQIQNLSKLLSNYILAGRKFSSAILELHEALSQIDLVVVNSSYSSLCDVLVGMNMILMNHLNQVEGTMHVPAQSFIKHDLSSVKKAKNDYFTINEKFIDTNDKIVTSQKKITGAERKQKIMELHSQSSHAFCEYVLQLDVTESRYNNLIGNLLINYATSVSSDVGLPLQQLYESKKDEIAVIQETISKSNEDITAKMFESNETHKLVDQQMPIFYDQLDTHFTGEPSTQIQGFLWRRKPMPSFMGQSEKLFCVCRDGFFAASASPATCARPLWTLQLVYCDIKGVDGDDRGNCFQIISRDRTIILQADSVYMKEKWISTLMRSKNEQFECPNEETVTGQETRTCADCGQRGADWLITNRGCVVCQECASIHRSISRVRSLRMDTNTSIDQYAIQIYHMIGNDAVNAILEANVGENKIKPTASRQERQEYIYKKYVEKDFITTEKVDLVTALKNVDVPQVLHCILDGSITTTLENGLTALHAAAIIGSPAMSALICANCQNMVNALDSFRWTPMMYATYYDHYFIVDCLLLYNADPLCDCEVAPYVIAASKRYDDIANKLVQYRPESFEVMSATVPETEFKPKEIDLSMYTIPETPQQPHIPRDRMASIQPAQSMDSGLKARRATLTPKTAPTFGFHHK